MFVNCFCLWSFCVIGENRFRVFLNLVSVKFFFVVIFWSIFNELFWLNFFIRNFFLLFRLWIFKCFFMMFLMIWFWGLLLFLDLNFVLKDWKRSFFWELYFKLLFKEEEFLLLLGFLIMLIGFEMNLVLLLEFLFKL